jgi:radical SAM protein with 4Fe4S-binding SPASM domain
LDTEHVERVLDELKRRDVGQITFTGGEPLLRHDVFEILEYARKLDFPSLGMVTNGCLISLKNAERIAGLLDFVQVSLHSADPDSHDLLVKTPGAFRRTVRAIEMLVDKGESVMINVTVTKLNLDDIVGLSELAKSLGVRGFSLTRFVPTGTGLKNISQLELSGEHIRKFVSNLLVIKERLGKGIYASIHTPIPFCSSRNTEVTKLLGQVYDSYEVSRCTAGLTWCAISPRGQVRPCTAMSMVAGSLLQDNLESIWCNSPILKQLRKMQAIPGTCKKCRFFHRCMGGCRAAALACGGKLDSHDPWSRNYKEVSKNVGEEQ